MYLCLRRLSWPGRVPNRSLGRPWRFKNVRGSRFATFATAGVGEPSMPGDLVPGCSEKPAVLPAAVLVGMMGDYVGAVALAAG